MAAPAPIRRSSPALTRSYDILNLFGLVLINGQDGTDLVLDVEFLKFDNGIYNVATHIFTPNTPRTAAGLGGRHRRRRHRSRRRHRLHLHVQAHRRSVAGADGQLFDHSGAGQRRDAGRRPPAARPAPSPSRPAATPRCCSSARSTMRSWRTPKLFSVVVGVGAGYQVDIPNATAGGSIIDNDVSAGGGVADARDRDDRPKAARSPSRSPAPAATSPRRSPSTTWSMTERRSAARPAPTATSPMPPACSSSPSRRDRPAPPSRCRPTRTPSVEGNESFSVLLAGGVDYTVDPVNNGSTGVIHDNDPAPLVSVARPTASAPRRSTAPTSPSRSPAPAAPRPAADRQLRGQ